MTIGGKALKLPHYSNKQCLFFENFKINTVKTNKKDVGDDNKLHHAHDKIIQVALHENEAMREFSEKIIMPQLQGIKIDLDNLQLDTTSYVSPSLKAFYSDIVYLTTIIDETTQTRETVKVALLIEHKSRMPSQLLLRLQVEEYINAIMKRNYNKKTDSTIPVIPIVFNQFNKGWVQKPFRSLFSHTPNIIKHFIPEFSLLMVNLADLPQATIDSLDKYGTLKATLLAMKNVRNKRFLTKHFEDIFVFLQGHPEKTDLRKQLVTYLLGHITFSPEEIQQMIDNIFSPILKQEVMVAKKGYIAVAYNQAKAQAEAKAEEKAQAKERLSVMRSWDRGIALDAIIYISDLPHNETTRLVAIFDKIKAYFQSKPTVGMAELEKLSDLNTTELKALVELLKQQQR